MKIIYCIVFIGLLTNMVFSQTDSIVSKELQLQKETLKELKKIKISGYLQPQFQYAEAKGIKYNGGDFGANVDTRFSLRRARLKTTYQSKRFEVVLVTENTERSFSLHDFYASYTMDKIGLKYKIGLFPRPFGFEQLYSSSSNEGPERSRFSNILLPSEADLGFSLSYINLKPFNLEVGIFNGNSTASDFDSYKDFIGRISADHKINTSAISGGLSFYHGGIMQGNNRLFKTERLNNSVLYVLQDSAIHSKGSSVLRQYFGADVQYSFNTILGQTTLRTEWMSGSQPGSSSSSDSPKTSTAPGFDTYSRKFNASSSYFIQNLGNSNFQLIVKYDWYDPNTKADNNDIGIPGSRLNETDIKYSTLGFGLNYYYQLMKILVYYEMISNEKTTNLSGFNEEIKDNVLTIRTQFKF